MKKTIILFAAFILLSTSYTTKAACGNTNGNNPICDSWTGDPGYHSDTWDMIGTTSSWGLHLYMGAYGGDAYASGSWSSTGTGSCYWNGWATTQVIDYYVVDGSITLTSYSSETSAFIAASW